MTTNKEIKNNIIDFPTQERKEVKQKITQKNTTTKIERASKKILVWLYCSKCKILEYTDIRSVAGRYHKCGVFVQEKEFEVDIRMEMTLCLLNLTRLYEIKKKRPKEILEQFTEKNVTEMICHLIDGEKKMLEKLYLYTNCKVEPYTDNKLFIAKMMKYVTVISFLKMHYSEFRFYPIEHANERKKNKETE